MIELLVLDVDGTLTDGSLLYSTEGVELKSFSVKDGLAIDSWVRLGKQVAIMTGRSSSVVQRRAQELKIAHIYQGVKDKGAKVLELRSHLGYSREQVAGIGDDLNDLKMFEEVGLSFAPNDAVAFVASKADVHLCTRGGNGAVREMIEYILRRDGLEEAFLALWR